MNIVTTDIVLHLRTRGTHDKHHTGDSLLLNAAEEIEALRDILRQAYCVYDGKRRVGECHQCGCMAGLLLRGHE